MKIYRLLGKSKISLFLLLIFALQTFTPLSLTAQDSRQLQREKSSTTDNKSNEKRTALVIGNSAYATSPLANPANDATDMTEALKSLNFEVISGVNQSRAEMVRAIRQFGERLKANGGVGLFYYAGHGVQVEGRNYLIPVDAAIRAENEVELEAVDTARILVEMENAGNSLNIVILDACRNNPFSRSWRSTNDGLAQINAPSGTLIAYSTAPGKVAADGAGRNAPYTAALLKTMKIPDLSLSDVFMQVRAEVQKTTNRQQIPWEASSVTGKFFFKQTDPNRTPGLQTPSDAQIEQEYWDSIKNSQNVADFQIYLKEYPNGRFAALARLKISQYEKPATVTNSTNKTPVNTNSLPSKTAGAISKASFPGEVNMYFAYIPPGEFQMGSTLSEEEGPVHTVKITEGFEMQTTEVTQGQWKAVMRGLPSKCDFGDMNYNFVDDNKPIICISWEEAQEFIRQLNLKNDGYKYRLPTEAEWEYAARAGTTENNVVNLDQVAWYESNSNDSIRIVGTKQANRWGLFDMYGNVWEWCQDWYGNYTNEMTVDPIGTKLSFSRVNRGGGWLDASNNFRVTLRGGNTPSRRSYDIGFRLLRK